MTIALLAIALFATIGTTPADAAVVDGIEATASSYCGTTTVRVSATDPLTPAVAAKLPIDLSVTDGHEGPIGRLTSANATTGLSKTYPAPPSGRSSGPIIGLSTNGPYTTMKVEPYTDNCPGGFQPVTPSRLFDSRTQSEKVGGGFFVPVPIPYDHVTAVAVNVTATGPEAPGFLTVYPCGTSVPLASSLNYTAGETVPNLALVDVVGVSPSGQVCVYTSAKTHIIVDLMGYFTNDPIVGENGNQLAGLTPRRLLDTRTAIGAPKARVQAGSVLTLPVAGVSGVPADSAAVVLNVTVAGAASTGYVTVYPCGTTRPISSNLNFVADQTVPNAVVVGVGQAGSVCFYADATVDLIADVTGYFSAGESRDFAGIRPRRLIDSRTDPFVGLTDPEKVDAGGRIELSLTDVSPGTPVAFNVTVTQPESAGFVTVYPCAEGLPLASNLNFVAGQTVANAVVVVVDAQREICFETTATTHMIVDVTGAYLLASELAT